MSSRRIRLAAVSAALAIAVSGLVTQAPATAAPAGPGDPSKPTTAAQKAGHSALQRARQVLSPAAHPAPGTRVEATLVLRDLANRLSDLTPADREAARDLFKRPTDPGGDGNVTYTVSQAAPVCSTDICVHYVTSSADASTLAVAQQTLAIMQSTHDTYVASGYREPKSDGTVGGGTAKIDVYLANIGPGGLYGYCTSDDPADAAPYDRWAYCVLDNDYSAGEFPTNSPLENLQVTAAHEYFHATQFAYDAFEDSWLLEATAAWVEDEMYDDVDDNLQYLERSQLTRPQTPLDTFEPQGSFHYGTWSFFRLLTEKYPTKVGALPRLVLDIFRKADGAAGGPDQYSWQAVDNVLRAKGTSGAAMLGTYAVANRRPGSSYAEGKKNRYPTAPLAGALTLTPRKNGAKASPKLDHLATSTYKLAPSRMSNGTWRLKVSFNLAPSSQGSQALITSTSRSGKVSTKLVRLNASGDATARVPFSNAKVKNVEITLVNGSGRFSCYIGGAYSCNGDARDQQVKERFTATAYR